MEEFGVGETCSVAGAWHMNEICGYRGLTWVGLKIKEDENVCSHAKASMMSQAGILEPRN